MPNHVTNRIRFTGDPQAIQRLLRAVAYDDLSEMDIPDGVNTIDFNKIIPQPAELYRGDLGKSEREKYKRNNWYDWNNIHLFQIITIVKSSRFKFHNRFQ